MFDGLARLKSDIRERKKPFCICRTAAEYHVGANDAMDTFERATDRDGLLERREAAHPEDRVYSPRLPLRDRDLLAREEEELSEDVQRIYSLLHRAFPHYVVGRRLKQQEGEIHERFMAAFDKLCRYWILPVTTGNAAFNHQGMTLLMHRCFDSSATLVSYLQDPDRLRLPENYTRSDAANEERTRLLVDKYSCGLDDDGLRSLDAATLFVRAAAPRVSDEQRDATREMSEEVAALAKRNRARRRQLATAGERTVAVEDDDVDDVIEPTARSPKPSPPPTLHDAVATVLEVLGIDGDIPNTFPNRYRLSSTKLDQSYWDVLTEAGVATPSTEAGHFVVDVLQLERKRRRVAQQ